MAKEWSELAREAVEALKAGEVARAQERMVAMDGAAPSSGARDPSALAGAWGPFVRLLYRRGYFVSSPRLLEVTLREILEMGPGFDLYDLTTALARCDALLARSVAGSRLFPELRPFAPDEPGMPSS